MRSPQCLLPANLVVSSPFTHVLRLIEVNWACWIVLPSIMASVTRCDYPNGTGLNETPKHEKATHFL